MLDEKKRVIKKKIYINAFHCIFFFIQISKLFNESFNDSVTVDVGICNNIRDAAVEEDSNDNITC